MAPPLGSLAAEMVPPLHRATNELANAERKLAAEEKKFSDTLKKLPEAQRDAAKASEWAAASARSGALTAFTGISDPYEPPQQADIVLDTSRVSVEEAVARLMALWDSVRASGLPRAA